MKKRIHFYSYLPLFILLLLSINISEAWQEGVNLPGSDYRSFFQQRADPSICKRTCSAESDCKAWTYVKPGIQGTKSKCWLKHSVPRSVASSCCSSGVKKKTNGGGSTVKGHASGIYANSGRDYVGPNEQYRRNGKTDAVFQVSIYAPNHTIRGIEVRNTNGQYSVWDTHPNNGYWLGAVVVDGQTRNHSNGSVNFRLGPGKKLIKFYAEDNGSVRGGKTNFRMTVTFANGKILVIPLNPSPPSQTTFNNPKVNGYIVDNCKTWATNCNGGGAQLFCRSKGFNKAVNWKHNRPGATYVMGSNQVCRGNFCVGYSSITCR